MISTALPAFEYLINTRKLSEKTIRDFNLAYCDPKGEIYIGAEFAGIFPNLDFRFRNASLFPICDLYGDVVGVSCRPLISNPKLPKYINTVYDKSKHLYGLNVTWKDCISENKVYVVEGNVDVLQMYQAGITNVVGMLGSAFSFTQLCLLSRFVKKIVLVPDGDKAGTGLIKRMNRDLVKKFYDADVEFLRVELPAGLDPDNYLKQNSKQDFLALPELPLAL